MLELDHLAIAAGTLAEGSRATGDLLGRPLQPGGTHPHFGTHNRLLGLACGLYLEAIAIDPAAPPPGYPRWFDLDRFTGPPRLTNWICRTRDLPAMLARFPQAGRAVALSRGGLRWQMAVPADGILPFDNLFPALICWQGTDHPARMLPDSGCRLERLTVRHPRAHSLARMLAPVLDDPRIAFEAGPPRLSARIATPDGPAVLT